MFKARLDSLCFLDQWSIRKFSPEYHVPEPAGDTEPVLVIGIVVLKVILLEASVIGGEPATLNVSIHVTILCLE